MKRIKNFGELAVCRDLDDAVDALIEVRESAASWMLRSDIKKAQDFLSEVGGSHCALNIEWDIVHHRERLLNLAKDRSVFVLAMGGYDEARRRTEDGLRLAFALRPQIADWLQPSVNARIARAIEELDRPRVGGGLDVSRRQMLDLGDLELKLDKAVTNAFGSVRRMLMSLPHYDFDELRLAESLATLYPDDPAAPSPKASGCKSDNRRLSLIDPFADRLTREFPKTAKLVALARSLEAQIEASRNATNALRVDANGQVNEAEFRATLAKLETDEEVDAEKFAALITKQRRLRLNCAGARAALECEIIEAARIRVEVCAQLREAVSEIDAFAPLLREAQGSEFCISQETALSMKSVQEILQHALTDDDEHDRFLELRIALQWAMLNCLAVDYDLRHDGKLLASYAEALNADSDITTGEAQKCTDAEVAEAFRRYQPGVTYSCVQK